MEKEKDISLKEFENLKKEVIEAYKEKYRSISDLLETTLEMSKNTNRMMKKIHESLSGLEGLFKEFYDEEKYSMLYEAVTIKDIKVMLDSMSLISEEVNTMGKYALSISDDVTKVLETDD